MQTEMLFEVFLSFYQRNDGGIIRLDEKVHKSVNEALKFSVIPAATGITGGRFNVHPKIIKQTAKFAEVAVGPNDGRYFVVSVTEAVLQAINAEATKPEQEHDPFAYLDGYPENLLGRTDDPSAPAYRHYHPEPDDGLINGLGSQTHRET